MRTGAGGRLVLSLLACVSSAATVGGGMAYERTGRRFDRPATGGVGEAAAAAKEVVFVRELALACLGFGFVALVVSLVGLVLLTEMQAQGRAAQFSVQLPGSPLRVGRGDSWS